MSDYIRAVAETTDEQAAQLAVEAAGAPPPWASGLEEAQVGLALGGARQGAGEAQGRSVHSIRASGSSGTGLNEAAATAAHALDIARQNHDRS